MRDNMGLYRGKRESDGKWVEGYLYPGIGQHKGKWLITVVDDCLTTSRTYSVLPETIGQFIGAADKNRHGIFEGDIVKFKNELFEVKFIEKYSRFAGVKPGVVFSVFLFSNSEVVGNIHDNPELMKVNHGTLKLQGCIADKLADYEEPRISLAKISAMKSDNERLHALLDELEQIISR